MADVQGRGGDLVLAPGEFAFVLDETKGLISTLVGPNKTSMSNTDQTVLFDKASRKFVRVPSAQAVQIDSIAPEGFYIALYNPSKETKSPAVGTSSPSVNLNIGHRINIPGPVNFPLWPGQIANVIQGHHLRSNHYLLAQVYNDVEATANWSKAVLKPAGGKEEETLSEIRSFAPGQLIIIKGTDVAFFIPPTGIKVVPETPKGKDFIREAVTLERLEYCILLDEDGNKRFVKGPDVVFPEPTETFIKGTDNSRKFRAIELNETTGIYVKVIADYKDEKTGQEHHTGDELFITGKEQAIYFQREEHSVIRYGDQTKHYAVAIPAGEGRYVLNRQDGTTPLVRGPKMLLCDPRTEVIIRRVLSESTVKLWYPNNERVLQVNRELAALTNVSDPSQYLRSATINYAAMNEGTRLTSKQLAGDTFVRSGTFTPPRTVTLDTKYEGAVAISVWTGYAVLIINKRNERRVAVGPENILLEYDETLAQMELSTGKPKTDEKVLKTVYLRVKNNVVSDVIHVETKDLVKVKLTVSYRVNFEGDPSKWFEVENYVRLLCDHMRSLIRNLAKRTNIEEFYARAIDLVRDEILGPKAATPGPRAGRLFEENNMRIYDVEILDVNISDPAVAALLLDAQSDALKATILVAKQERQLEVTKRLESINQESASAKTATVVRTHELTQEEIAAKLSVELDRIISEGKTAFEKLKNQQNQLDVEQELNEAERADNQADIDQRITTRKKEIELELQRINGETDEITKRASAVSPNLAVALTTFSDQALIEKISTALAPMAAMNGISAADVLSQLFKGSPFEDVMKGLGTRSRMPVFSATDK